MKVLIHRSRGIPHEKNSIIPNKSVSGRGFAAAIGQNAGNDQFLDHYGFQALIKACAMECIIPLFIKDRLIIFRLKGF